MSFQSIGDLSGSLRLQLLNTNLKQQASRLGHELASGRAADVSKKLEGGLDRLGMLTRSVTMIETYQITLTELENRATGLQSSLKLVQDVTGDSSAKMLAAATTPTETATFTAGTTALEGLKSVIGALNTQLAGRSLFSGQDVRSPAMVSAAEMLDDLALLATGVTTASALEAIVDDYFNLPGGDFETSAYLGSQTSPGPVRISETESADMAVTAAEPELRRAFTGHALAALLTRGILAGDSEAQASVLNSAGETLIAAHDDLIALRAEIGGKEERIDRAEAANQARITGYKVMIDEMTGVDGYETATGLQSVETRLEALYIATSRLSQLSLVKYLR